jgi:hypothetical protein
MKVKQQEKGRKRERKKGKREKEIKAPSAFSPRYSKFCLPIRFSAPFTP